MKLEVVTGRLCAPVPTTTLKMNDAYILFLSSCLQQHNKANSAWREMTYWACCVFSSSSCAVTFYMFYTFAYFGQIFFLRLATSSCEWWSVRSPGSGSSVISYSEVFWETLHPLTSVDVTDSKSQSTQRASRTVFMCKVVKTTCLLHQYCIHIDCKCALSVHYGSRLRPLWDQL